MLALMNQNTLGTKGSVLMRQTNLHVYG